MELFRGFVPAKKKKCTMQFKGVPSSQLMTYYAMFKDINYCSRGIKKDGDDNV